MIAMPMRGVMLHGYDYDGTGSWIVRGGERERVIGGLGWRVRVVCGRLAAVSIIVRRCQRWVATTGVS